MAKQFKIVTSVPKTPKHQIADGIKISDKAHTDLVAYIKTRLDFAHELRTKYIDRYREIDKEFAGYMVLDPDDAKRKEDNVRGFGPKVYDVNIPLAATQMDEAVTFFTTVFFPEEGPYTAVTTAEKQEIAKGFSALMNKQASFYKHFRHFAKGAYSGLKYNLGLWLVEWQNTKGSVIQNGAGGIAPDIKENETVMQGNKLEHLNVYNTLLDPTVDPTELHEKGEFFATIEMITPFRARIMEQNNEIFGLSRVLDTEDNTKGNSEPHYYEELPEIHGDSQFGSSSTKTNWVQFLSASGGSASSIEGLELINLYIWLPAKKFEMSQSNVYQIWRVTLLNMHVVAVERLTNAHGFLPLLATMPWDDEFQLDANSYGEMLLPYQRFSSFQINIHQRASRKALYNLILYNSKLLPLLADADSLGGKVPFSATMDINDINKAVKVISDTPDTQNTLRDVQDMDTLMQKILPTDILKQVASLERATQYQAAATVQGANRRNLKIAKIIDTQAFSVGKKMQMYNILQFQEAVDVLDEQGNTIQINPSELREEQMEFAISDGLRGLDKLILVETMKDIVNMLVQNPQAAAEFDIADIVDYVTTLIGDHTSFRQFRFENEFDKLTPELKQIAFQLLQRAQQQQSEQEAAGNAGEQTQ